MELMLSKRAEDKINDMSAADNVTLVDAITTFLDNPEYAICKREEILESGKTRRIYVDLPKFSLVFDLRRGQFTIHDVTKNNLTDKNRNTTSYYMSNEYLSNIIESSTARLPAQAKSYSYIYWQNEIVEYDHSWQETSRRYNEINDKLSDAIVGFKQPEDGDDKDDALSRIPHEQ